VGVGRSGTGQHIADGGVWAANKRDAFDTFGVDRANVRLPTSLSELATTVAVLARAGYVVVLDEFQYFHRKVLSEFPSHLQREVDGLTAEASSVTGGLFVLGSIHTELTALLDNRSAPLYNRYSGCGRIRAGRRNERPRRVSSIFATIKASRRARRI